MNKLLISNVLGIFLCATSFVPVYANGIVDILQEQIGGKFSVIDQSALSQDKNLKIVTLKDENSGMRAFIITNTQESIIVPISAVFTSNDADRELINSKATLVASYNETYKTHAAVKAVIDKMPKDYIISLKGSGKKKFYIISDPMCPHCQVELNNIDKRLTDGDVYMIPIGMLGDASAKKTAQIHELMKTAKNDKDKISILKKVYSKTYDAPNSIDTKKVQEITRSLIGEGKVSGTPYIIEEDN